MRILAVIPARGGSKGVPRKNVRLLAGKPLITYTFETAQQTTQITRCILSTDDPEIAELARQHDIDVPFIRPAHLSTDTASTLDVVLHAISAIEAQDQTVYDQILLLQPTTPLRQAQDIAQSIDLLEQTRADSVVSFYQVERDHPYYMYTLKDGEPAPLMQVPKHITRRQDFPPVYVRNGAIYLTRRDILVGSHSFYGKDVKAHLMPYERSINIDGEVDFIIAEHILRQGAS